MDAIVWYDMIYDMEYTCGLSNYDDRLRKAEERFINTTEQKMHEKQTTRTKQNTKKKAAREMEKRRRAIAGRTRRWSGSKRQRKSGRSLRSSLRFAQTQEQASV